MFSATAFLCSSGVHFVLDVVVVQGTTMLVPCHEEGFLEEEKNESFKDERRNLFLFCLYEEKKKEEEQKKEEKKQKEK